MEDKKTSEDKLSTFSQRLKDKISGSPAAVPAEEIVTELLDSQIDAVSGGRADHISGHISIDT